MSDLVDSPLPRPKASSTLYPPAIIVDLRINETLQTGAVENRTYQVRNESVYLFLEFTIVDSTNTSYSYGMRKENTIREDSHGFVDVFLPIKTNRRIP